MRTPVALPDIRAVAFDLDGTLYPYQSMVLISSVLVLQYPRFFFHLAAVREELRKIRPISGFHALQAELLAQRMRISTYRASTLLQNILYRDWPAILQMVGRFPGVCAFIRDLQAHGIRTAILSDFPIRQKLMHLGLEGGWTTLICSEDIGYLKPSPEPFLALVEELQCAPHEVLYIGDNYHYDMQGAHNTGLQYGHVRLFPHLHRSNLNPLIEFSDYRLLHDWCKKNLAIL